jgi:3-deoxy-manno-octulosonate cytidylyltransferase (CMP-KDO synthetase)
MVQWTYENAKRCKAITEVVVATDSEEIADVIQKANGSAILTPENILTGTDRVALVAQHYPHMEVVINLQGDEPFVNEEMLLQLISPYLAGENPEMTTLAHPLNHESEYQSPAIVKVITDLQNNAIYFSRSPIPYLRCNEPHPPVFHHMGIYAFRRKLLMAYASWPQTPLEKIESLEQLRVLEYGYKIRVCFTKYQTLEINTPQEYERAQFFKLDQSI